MRFHAGCTGFAGERPYPVRRPFVRGWRTAERVASSDEGRKSGALAAAPNDAASGLAAAARGVWGLARGGGAAAWVGSGDCPGGRYFANGFGGIGGPLCPVAPAHPFYPLSPIPPSRMD